MAIEHSPRRRAPRTLAMFGVQQHNAPGHVLCCMCGVGMPPNPAGMCVDCIRSQVRPSLDPAPADVNAPPPHFLPGPASPPARDEALT